MRVLSNCNQYKYSLNRLIISSRNPIPVGYPYGTLAPALNTKTVSSLIMVCSSFRIKKPQFLEKWGLNSQFMATSVLVRLLFLCEVFAEFFCYEHDKELFRWNFNIYSISLEIRRLIDFHIVTFLDY